MGKSEQKGLNATACFQEIIGKTRRVVIKTGSSLLVGPDEKLSFGNLSGIAQGIAGIQKKGVHVILVSSGAIASGMQHLGFQHKPHKIAEQQACAAVGQPILIQMYQKALEPAKLQVAQVLLTRDDLTDHARSLNAKHALAELLARNVIPIINENDTVAVEEIRVGDNDNLAALVTSVTDADLLILLTDQDGFYTSDPRIDPKAEKISVVENLDDETFSWASSTLGKTTVGGMKTKLEAAQKAAELGVPTIIANGKDLNVLEKIFNGGPTGTLFLLEKGGAKGAV